MDETLRPVGARERHLKIRETSMPTSTPMSRPESGKEVVEPRRGGAPKEGSPTRSRDESVGTLRGAEVAVDLRRLGRVITAACLVTLAVVATVLFVAGAKKNDQIALLRQHGVPVPVTVTTCLGLMGGSGSNLVGYQCKGTYVVGGHRYVEAIPGTAPHAPGTTLRGVTVPDDPALFSTPGALATQHRSERIFLLPTILSAVLVLFAGSMFIRGRRGPSSPRTSTSRRVPTTVP